MIPVPRGPRSLLSGLLAIVLGACGEAGAGGPGGTGAAGSGGSFASASAGAAGQPGSATTAGSGGAGQTSSAGSGTNGGTSAAAGASAGGAVAIGGTAGSGAGGLGAAGRGQAAGTAGSGGQPTTPGRRSISFGTLLDAQAVVSSARALATSLADPGSSKWRAKGDQHRSYHFAEANADEPYRIYVPTNWDGSTSLPLAMFLHGAGSDENTYLDQNNQQMVKLAQEHGYLLVSPLGASGAYGNFLRLTAPFGDEAGAAELMAAVTTETERTNELSEQDVINVLELVLAEYPVDRDSVFLFGHSMGSGGTWYLGGKYAAYWQGIAPMSGPFVQETGYPWASVHEKLLFVTEGTQAPSLDASRLLADWLEKGTYRAQYREVNADHGGMVSLALPSVFDFFDDSRGK